MSRFYRIEKPEFKDVDLDFLIDDLDLITLRDDNDNLLPSGDLANAPVYSTMVEVEIQFLTDNNPDLDPTTFKSFLPAWVIENSWIDNTLWIHPDCWEDMKGTYLRCPIYSKYRLILFQMLFEEYKQLKNYL